MRDLIRGSGTEHRRHEKQREILEFMGHVVKKVPRPHRITVKKKYLGMQKVVKLTFKCPRTGEEFSVKSKSLGLWFKFLYTLLKAGKSALEIDVEGAVEGGIAALQAAYNVFHEKDDDRNSFDALMRAPLLLSKEQDELVGGLRKAKFMERFAYNPQTGEWETRRVP